MNKFIILILLSLLLNNSSLLAQSIGSAFNYQGELIDNGSPANGEYDITIKLHKTETGGSATAEEDFLNILVENGLFNLEVDFGDVVYENMAQYFIEIELTPSAGGSTSVLAPRSKLLAVPHAVQAQFLAPGGASNGDILQYNSGNWGPVGVSSISPWDVNGSAISTQGSVGIGPTNPTDRLHIDAEVGEDPFRVQINNQTKLRVRDNGGTSLGVNATPPENGLYVSGDVKQSQNSNGMLKYMFRANCDSSPHIVREFNGTNIAGSATITRPDNGLCVITLPIDVTNNYISATAASTSNLNVACFGNSTDLGCKISNGSTGAGVDGTFDVLIY